MILIGQVFDAYSFLNSKLFRGEMALRYKLLVPAAKVLKQNNSCLSVLIIDICIFHYSFRLQECTDILKTADGYV